MNLKSLLFTTVEDTSPKVEDVVEETQEAHVNMDSKVEMNVDVLEAIKNALDDANLDGYDYYEFMKTIAEQQDMPSEKKKFQIVYSVVKTMNITTEHLLSSASHYIDVVSDHREKFKANLAFKEQEMVVKLVERGELIESTITAKSDQIDALKSEIQNLSEEKVDVVGVANENRAQLAKLYQEGSLAYDVVTSQIEDGKSKINKYLS